MALCRFSMAAIAAFAAVGVCSSALAQRQLETAPGPAAAPELQRKLPTQVRPAPRDIRRPPAPPLLITTANTLPPASRGKLYSHTLSLSGGKGPYQWSVIGGRLPAGLTMSSAGVLLGTPAASGSFSFSVRVTDSTVGKPGEMIRNFTLTVAPITVPTGVAPPAAPSGAVPASVTTGALKLTGAAPPAAPSGAVPASVTTGPLKLTGAGQ